MEYAARLTASYTTFEMSSLRITARHVPDDTSVQRTSERHEGRAGLYDVIVSTPTATRGVADVVHCECQRDEYW